jgi:hypothetical protein
MIDQLKWAGFWRQPMGLIFWKREPSIYSARLCHPVAMKTRNQREMEKHWAKEAAKKPKVAKKAGRREDRNEAAARIARQGAKS